MPDLSIYSKDLTRIFAIFEITTHRRLLDDIEKCEELMERFPEMEYFVYDYEDDVWYAYDAEADEWYNSNNEEIHSRYLKRPLPDYLA
ncbi:MAG: hypothetical protein IJS82_05655 [Paludibacteraceae bacterium]|nr:hypothetical protein [Paludibacteraceae bacterium]